MALGNSEPYSGRWIAVTNVLFKVVRCVTPFRLLLFFSRLLLVLPLLASLLAIASLYLAALSVHLIAQRIAKALKSPSDMRRSLAVEPLRRSEVPLLSRGSVSVRRVLHQLDRDCCFPCPRCYENDPSTPVLMR